MQFLDVFILQFALCALVVAIDATPGLGYGLHASPVLPAPIIPASVIPAPIFPAPTIVKSYPAPVFSPPILKTPIIASAPIIKTVAPIPIIKHIAPATSYASITQYAAAPIVKTVVAPQPIIKSYAVAAPLPVHGLSAFHH
ncbi:hypothetical protein RN001_002974 [Aquatica leii]|uniref:Uncharacterized protein n=1 Tax=Aquatica leii TaxID=1421715 RepID=A0AAN7PHZ0_9COLE|nr:hypothetical protein RN001_002974 [Aquatica leii]